MILYPVPSAEQVVFARRNYRFRLSPAVSGRCAGCAHFGFERSHRPRVYGGLCTVLRIVVANAFRSDCAVYQGRPDAVPEDLEG